MRVDSFFVVIASCLKSGQFHLTTIIFARNQWEIFNFKFILNFFIKFTWRRNGTPNTKMIWKHLIWPELIAEICGEDVKNEKKRHFWQAFMCFYFSSLFCLSERWRGVGTHARPKEVQLSRESADCHDRGQEERATALPQAPPTHG